MSIIRDLFRHLDWANQTMLDALHKSKTLEHHHVTITF